MQDLKPCPFCGGADLELEEIDEGYYVVACETCDAFGPMGEGEQGAMENWNYRAGG